VGGGAGGFDCFGHGAAEVAAIGDDIAAEPERLNQFWRGRLVGRLAGVRTKRTGRPGRSTTAWVLLVSPPRERPMA
jgi:hypothetical protein